jgi:hypothetical protein
MSRKGLPSLVSFLIWCSAGFCQAPEKPAAPEQPPAPAAEASHAPTTPAFAGLSGLCNGLCCGIPGCNLPGVFTADAGYILGFYANSTNSSVLASSDILSRGTALGGLGDAEHGTHAPVSGGYFGLSYLLPGDSPPLAGHGICALGAETRFFFIGDRSVSFQDSQSPTIFRPFFDLNDRMESAVIVASPGLATGRIAATSKVDLWGAEANVWRNFLHDGPGSNFLVDLLAGFRYLSSDHHLEVDATSVFNPNLAAFPTFLPFAGNRLDVFDSFTTHNRFYGAQVGISSKWSVESLMIVEGIFKLAIGETSEELNIVGSQLRTFPNGATATSVGGLLALPSNIGRHHHDQFAQVPELDFNLIFPLVHNLRFSAGFSALYWSRILRPGQQVDRSIDITQIPNFPGAAGAVPTGLASPGVPFRQSDLWLLGIQIGLEATW